MFAKLKAMWAALVATREGGESDGPPAAAGDYKAAIDFAVQKGKQIIDLQGDRIFM